MRHDNHHFGLSRRDSESASAACATTPQGQAFAFTFLLSKHDVIAPSSEAAAENEGEDEDADADEAACRQGRSTPRGSGCARGGTPLACVPRCSSCLEEKHARMRPSEGSMARRIVSRRVAVEARSSQLFSRGSGSSVHAKEVPIQYLRCQSRVHTTPRGRRRRRRRTGFDVPQASIA